MKHDEHEMLVEFSEMTAFNFNSKEYKELEKDLLKCKKVAKGFENIFRDFVERFQAQAVV